MTNDDELESIYNALESEDPSAMAFQLGIQTVKAHLLTKKLAKIEEYVTSERMTATVWGRKLLEILREDT